MNTRKLFMQIALENNTTPQEIRKEIEKAIDEAMNNPDPKTRIFWDNIPKRGARPTPEEVIAYAAAEVKKKRSLS